MALAEKQAVSARCRNTATSDLEHRERSMTDGVIPTSRKYTERGSVKQQKEESEGLRARRDERAARMIARIFEYFDHVGPVHSRSSLSSSSSTATKS